tara:strand:- start:235 stop:822 length:588 start_codon:yes stop_codon:yes gene_type:complete
MNREAWVKPALKAKEYSHNHQGGNRSSKRTDILNSEMIALLSNYFSPDDYKFLTEVKVPCSRGRTFSVDIFVQNKHDRGEWHIVLLKAVERDFNKNSHNYANTQVGEALRIFANGEIYEKCSVIFVDWIPKKVVKKDKIEITKPRDQSKEFELLQAGIDHYGHKDCKIISAKIHYDEVQADGWQKIDEQLKQLAA